MRNNALSDPRWQVGETAAVGDDRVELGQLLVATMVAAFGDELARDVELFARFFLEPRGFVRRQAKRAAAGSARRGR